MCLQYMETSPRQEKRRSSKQRRTTAIKCQEQPLCPLLSATDSAEAEDPLGALNSCCPNAISTPCCPEHPLHLPSPLAGACFRQSPWPQTQSGNIWKFPNLHFKEISRTPSPPTAYGSPPTLRQAEASAVNTCTAHHSPSPTPKQRSK